MQCQIKNTSALRPNQKNITSNTGICPVNYLSTFNLKTMEIKAYGKRILTLQAESELIQHKEQFRDSRRGNATLIKRMKWLKRLNNHNNIALYNEVGINYITKLKVTISKS